MNTELISYNTKFVPHPFGLTNSGAICWFNSLIQSLLSCSSLNETLIKNESKFKSNSILNHYQNILKFGLTSNMDKVNSTNKIFTGQDHVAIIELIKKIQKQSLFKVKLSSGNQDANEGLVLIIDAINNQTITELFQLRYRTFIRCLSCKHTHESSSTNGDINVTIDIAMDIFDEKANDHQIIIQNYISNHNEYIDNGYVCTNCNVVGNSVRVARLTMLPEILVLLFKKYTNVKSRTTAVKKNIKFPEHLTFNENKLNYKLVAHCEHSGSLGGGHYWAVALRQAGIYNLNDTSTTISKFNSTPGSYLVFYHYTA